MSPSLEPMAPFTVALPSPTTALNGWSLRSHLRFLPSPTTALNGWSLRSHLRFLPSPATALNGWSL
ncbi:hypothetical protein, partial [Streptomyces sp. NPDC018031]|uniref:hypothetical protein n=1 Tax=Streptomyces sp. NPDC018031 TaxID=3365033 RepID=UPI0037AAAC9D